jgi:hypothetical protein
MNAIDKSERCTEEFSCRGILKKNWFEVWVEGEKGRKESFRGAGCWREGASLISPVASDFASRRVKWFLSAKFGVFRLYHFRTRVFRTCLRMSRGC